MANCEAIRTEYTKLERKLEDYKEHFRRMKGMTPADEAEMKGFEKTITALKKQYAECIAGKSSGGSSRKNRKNRRGSRKNRKSRKNRRSTRRN